MSSERLVPSENFVCVLGENPVVAWVESSKNRMCDSHDQTEIGADAFPSIQNATN